VVSFELVRGDGIRFMQSRAPASVAAIVTDPPYGLREYEPEEQAKLRRGRGGVWRIPPSLDGHARSPLPRFTVLSETDLARLGEFFVRFAKAAHHALAPGGHVLIATQPLLSHLVFGPLLAAGFEKRGEIVRLVQTLRGGDRPKNAEREFPGVSVMPRSAWEPWGVFRKPCEGRVQDNLRRYATGGLRRTPDDRPFTDVIRSAPTRSLERDLAPHPSLKPQAFMRQLVHAALPLGEGTLLDPFMGAGSTIAAAIAVGYASIGVELDPKYFTLARRSIPKLAALRFADPAARAQKLPRPARARD
jgi:site-specific DNA-methyltransferase (adenine-specific)